MFRRVRSALAMHNQPAKDDVIVAHKAGRKAAPWALRTTSGRDQLLFVTRDGAVAHALAFARFAQVAAWFEDTDSGMVLLISCRAARFPATVPVGPGLVTREQVKDRVTRVAPNLQH
ncbi:MAG: hypothetical protein IPL75_06290 [Acidobacteria bacterium]|nr:hypothetical protein [Acidobacteriota bacterium]